MEEGRRGRDVMLDESAKTNRAWAVKWDCVGFRSRLLKLSMHHCKHSDRPQFTRKEYRRTWVTEVTSSNRLDPAGSGNSDMM